MNTQDALSSLSFSTEDRPRHLIRNGGYYIKRWTGTPEGGQTVTVALTLGTAKALIRRGVKVMPPDVDVRPLALRNPVPEAAPAPVRITPPPAPSAPAPDVVGGFFWLANNRLEVIKVDSFGGVEHYGFRSVPSMSAHPGASTGTALIGWVPSALVHGLELTA